MHFLVRNVNIAMLVYQKLTNNKFTTQILEDFLAAGGIANLGELCTDALITTYGLQRVAIVSWAAWLHRIHGKGWVKRVTSNSTRCIQGFWLNFIVFFKHVSFCKDHFFTIPKKFTFVTWDSGPFFKRKIVFQGALTTREKPITLADQVESAHLLPVAMVNAFGQTSPALTTAAEIYQARKTAGRRSCFSQLGMTKTGCKIAAYYNMIHSIHWVQG